ncbi:hypothetical protein BGZ46_001534, partial [Entomortierella lignicola]
MDCGTLKTQFKKALAENYTGDIQGRQALEATVLKTIREMVRIGTEVTRIAQQAIACYIAHITQLHPTL